MPSKPVQLDSFSEPGTSTARSRFLEKLFEVLSYIRPFGIDVFCTGKKFLVFNLVGRNLKVKYRRSALGLLWTLAHPLSMTAIYFFVFKVILKVQIPHYLVFMLSGILSWNFFASSVSEGLESLVGNMGILTKIPVPVQVFPFSGTVTNLVTWLLSFPILIGAGLISGAYPGWAMISLPYFIVALFVIAYSLSVVLGIAFVYFRDLRHILSLILQAWFYGTPVIYNAEMIPVQYRWILFMNPVGHIFTAIHGIFVENRFPSVIELLMSGVWSTFMLLAALMIYKRLSGGLIENL